MGKRAYQIFRSSIDEQEEVDLESSPWFVEGDAIIPLEHWDALQEVADERHFVDWDLWNDMSDLDEYYCDLDELQMFVGGLKELQRFLRTDMMLMLQKTSSCPEPLPGSEHARMISAVLTVLDISRTEVESYVEAEE